MTCKYSNIAVQFAFPPLVIYLGDCFIYMFIKSGNTDWIILQSKDVFYYNLYASPTSPDFIYIL